MANDDNPLNDIKEDFLGDDDEIQNDDAFYSDDVQAQALAENMLDPELLEEDDLDQVTSGDMEIGDLDADAEEGMGGEDSYDEESVPAGDNVVD